MCSEKNNVLLSVRSIAEFKKLTERNLFYPYSCPFEADIIVIVFMMVETTFQGREGDIIKPFTTIAILVFSLVAFMHLLRLLFGWEVIVSGVIVPIWISMPGFFIASGLALMLWRESRK